MHGRAITALAALGHGQIGITGFFPVFAGEHAEHAGHGFGCAGVDFQNFRMGVFGANNNAEGLARHADIVGIAATAADEARILEARHRLAERIFTHRIHPYFCLMSA